MKVKSIILFLILGTTAICCKNSNTKNSKSGFKKLLVTSNLPILSENLTEVTNLSDTFYFFKNNEYQILKYFDLDRKYTETNTNSDTVMMEVLSEKMIARFFIYTLTNKNGLLLDTTEGSKNMICSVDSILKGHTTQLDFKIDFSNILRIDQKIEKT